MPPEELIRREVDGDLLVVRAAPGDDGERIIEGPIFPIGVPATVADRLPGGGFGRPYREQIARSAAESIDPARVTMEYPEHHGTLIGRAQRAWIAPHPRLPGVDAAWMAFRIARTAAGDDGLELARERVLTGLSILARPVAGGTRTLSDGTVERTAFDVRRVALLERGAYEGAEVTAVRAATEGNMPPEAQAPAASTAPAGEAGESTEDEAEATPPATQTSRPNRTRVTVDVERAANSERAALERAEVAQMARSRAPIYVTRDEFVYGPQSERSFLRDLVDSHQGNSEAQAAQARHGALLQDIAQQIERAGDVLSSEIPGAYPNTYLPGLLTPRILKGRPMGGFYNRVPIADARPQIFAKVTTSTSVAVQSAEGANPAASDFATTAVTATPLLYGAETVVSRQVIDGASPGAEQMVLQDMVEAYAQASETVIKTAVEAGSSASGTAITAATPFAGTQGNVITYYGTRFKPALGQFIPSALFSVLLNEADTTGRPKMPNLGPVNSNAITEDGGTGGAILGAQTYLSYASTANVVVTARPDDFVIFESPIARFSYDAVTGPSGVRLGIWAYLVVGARLGSLKVTAA